LVLKDLNLTVKQGETIALVGESGSGKSTVVNMAIGLFETTSGSITIDGKNIKELDMHSVRNRVAVVPQNTILFNGTIKENIIYGRTGVTKAELDKAIEAANLKHVLDKLPNGVNTHIGEHGDKLSGGQRQRISIARAIIRNPDVIIFDEATSALDTVSEAEIQSAINNLTKDRTTFIVAHRLSTIRNADKIAVISNGTCVEFGTYDELMQKKGEFYKYKMMQS
jgi:ATP-binding cassette subfamily B protein